MLHKKISLFFLRRSGSNISQFLRMHPSGDPGGIEGVFPIQYLARLEKNKNKQKNNNLELLSLEGHPPSLHQEPTGGM